MKHDILGEIKRDSDDGAASIDYESRKIDVKIIPDGQPFETALKLAADVVARLGEYDMTAKQIIVKDLRGTYNSGWNEFDEVQEDGSLKAVTNPQRSAAEFEKRFSLVGINVTGNTVVTLFYEDSGLFWGHSVFVSSLNGMDFSDAHADFFG
ncbi:MAG TPA: DUF2262 domain-containing protein [Pirellulaceae bacterium]|nr:DUF2262 domain-containing protein [Pirellulaceae bacterium]